MRLDRLYDPNQIRRIGQVAVVKDQPAIACMGILVQVINAIRIERRGAALDAVDFISLVEKELGEIGAVLPGHPSDKRPARFGSHDPSGQRLTRA